MLKKCLLALAVIGAFNFATATDANAWVVRRHRPVVRAVGRVATAPVRVVRGPVYYRRAVVAPTVVVAPTYPVYPAYYGGYYAW